MNELTDAIRRLETLYHDAQRNGGPDCELRAILRLLRKAETEMEELYWSEDDILTLPDESPDPAA